MILYTVVWFILLSHGAIMTHIALDVEGHGEVMWHYWIMPVANFIGLIVYTILFRPISEAIRDICRIA